jgi:hypothetical protein
MLFLAKKYVKAMAFIRRQVRHKLNKDSLSRSWITMKSSSFGRSGNVASANEVSDSLFEAVNSEVAAILAMLFAEGVGDER